MNKRLSMPPMSTPMIGKDGIISPAWGGFFKELKIHVDAERASGRVQSFWIPAADLLDATKFVQAPDPTAGLGVGEYLGWKICNGNNGTENYNGKSLRWSTTGASVAALGSDSNAHTHGAGTLSAQITLRGNTNHVIQNANATGFTSSRYASISGFTDPGVETSASSTVVDGSTASDGSATGNIPASMVLVPMMRV